jgi:single-strand DNA-binding protein
MNSLCFTGNCGKDGELKYLASGDSVLSFSVALSSGYGDKKITTWLVCSLFGKRAESLSPYIKKGSSVAVNGEFVARPYTTKEGVEKLSLEVRVADVTLMGGKPESGQSEPRQAAPARVAPAAKPAQSFSAFHDDLDDLPF